MYSGILVPLDGSQVAEIAIPYAELLAGLGSEVTLLHVCEDTHGEQHNMHKLYMEKMAENTRIAALQYKAKYNRKVDVEIKVKAVMLEGHPAEQIVDYAAREEIKMILIATHGRSGVGRWVLGSVANKVIRATNRPVNLIRAGTERTYNIATAKGPKILVPLDGSETSEKVLPYAVEMAEKINGEIILVNVAVPVYPGEFTPSTYHEEPWEELSAKITEYLKKISSRIEQKGIAVTYEVRSGDAADEIIRAADEQDADLVAMTCCGRSGFGSWAFGSTMEKVLNQGHQPLLLIGE